MKKVFNIGHQGAKGHYRGNTIRSIKIGKMEKCDVIEVDVRKTKDDIFVLYHDMDFKLFSKETLGFKETQIEKCNYIELFENGIVSMSEALDCILMKAIPYLDVKIEGEYENDIEYIENFIKLFSEKLKEYPDKIIFIASFNKTFIKKIAKINTQNNLLYGFLYENDDKISDEEIESKLYHFYGFEKGMEILKNNWKKLKKNDKLIFVYTINILEELKEYFNKNYIDGIVTDFPDKLHSLKKLKQD